jgi:hypothetical protein
VERSLGAVLYMVVEKFRSGAEHVYARAAEHGRMLPDALTYVDSWIDTALERCFQVMETERPELIDEDRALGRPRGLRVVEVLTSAEAASRAAG